jgi:membrane protease YdiL (CAAX protease family)
VDVLSSRPAWAVFAVWLGGIIGCWSVAWIVHQRLVAGSFPELGERTTDTAFWFVAKVVLWLAPTMLLVRKRAGHGRVLDWLGLARAPNAGVTLVACSSWIALQALVSAVSSNPPKLAPVDAGLLNALIVAPVFEEILFRGFALRLLVEGEASRALAIAATTLGWALLHLPGWLALGVAPHAMLVSLTGVVVLGAVLATLRLRYTSLWIPIAVHVANNLWHQGLVSRLW